MTSPYLPANRHQHTTDPAASASPATGGGSNAESSRQPRIGSRGRNRALRWKPRLSERPASALEARLADAFRLLDPRSVPLVSMLYGGTRSRLRNRAAGVAGRGRP